jgi:arylsulfatase A-like enzyme
VYSEVTDIPIVLWSSRGRVPAGVTVTSRVRSIDVAPTLLELAGVKPSEGAMSASLLPLCKNPNAEPGGRSAWLEIELGCPRAKDDPSRCQSRARALIDGSLKLIGRLEPEGTLHFELYDLACDPGERHDLAATGDAREPEIAKAYNSMLDRLSSLHLPSFSPQVVPDSVRHMLDQGGYLSGRGVRPDLAKMRHP